MFTQLDICFIHVAQSCRTRALLSLQAKLSATGDEAWKDREAAVLALGAIGEGCINGLYPHLSEVIFSDTFMGYIEFIKFIDG